MPYTRLHVPGLLSGIRPRQGARDLTFFDIGLYGGPREIPYQIDPARGLRTPLPKPVRILPGAIQQNPMHAVLPCKGLPDNVRVGRPERGTNTEGMCPKTGIGRHEKPGLAYLSEKPNTGPIMPIADNFYPAMNSRLGQPM